MIFNEQYEWLALACGWMVWAMLDAAKWKAKYQGFARPE